MEYEANTMNDSLEPAKNDPVKVILADDDKDDQEVFQDAITETHIPVDLTTVDNGQELLNHLKDPTETNPDIIFLDINMPVKNGKTVLAEIKEDETLKDIPTVMLSTSDNVKDVDDTFNAGASRYLQKPRSFRGLIHLLNKIFSLKWAGGLISPVRKAFFMSERDIITDDIKQKSFQP